MLLTISILLFRIQKKGYSQIPPIPVSCRKRLRADAAGDFFVLQFLKRIRVWFLYANDAAGRSFRGFPFWYEHPSADSLPGYDLRVHRRGQHRWKNFLM